MSRTRDVNGRDHFNQWSETYERSFMQWLLFDNVHKGVLKRVPAGFSPAGILDIGCGTGRLLRRMQARWPSAALAGVDLAEGMVAQARAQTPQATIYQAPAEHLPLENGSVDLVTSTVSFHHWTDQAQGVREAARVLRPGGLFILADMSLTAHGHPLSRTQVRAAFEAAGLVLRSQTDPVPFFTFTVGEKADPARL
ncbi:MAG TPA: class I SAM-dependent methyltransferase [Anaerolineales bacterium]|nr:class I SAM-dependent methyltransferase [Anaerolineales bacterium]